MRKSSHFSGQPLYRQLIKLLNKSKILDSGRGKDGEKYTNHLECLQCRQYASGNNFVKIA